MLASALSGHFSVHTTTVKKVLQMYNTFKTTVHQPLVRVDDLDPLRNTVCVPVHDRSVRISLASPLKFFSKPKLHVCVDIIGPLSAIQLSICSALCAVHEHWDLYLFTELS